MHLLKYIELYNTVSPNVNCRLQLTLMYQYCFIRCNKYSTLMQDVNNRRNCMQGREWVNLKHVVKNQSVNFFFSPWFFLFFFFFNSNLLFIFIFIFGCVGSSFLCEGFLQLRQAGATLHRGARASRYRSLSCCRAQAPDAQAQQLWLTGPVAPRHVGSPQTWARTRVPCIGRRILNHCATREAQSVNFFFNYFIQFRFYKVYPIM